jgi:hypothetical protein
LGDDLSTVDSGVDAGEPEVVIKGAEDGCCCACLKCDTLGLARFGTAESTESVEEGVLDSAAVCIDLPEARIGLRSRSCTSVEVGSGPIFVISPRRSISMTSCVVSSSLPLSPAGPPASWSPSSLPTRTTRFKSGI